MGSNPVTIQLRYLQTLREIGGQQNSTIVFPMPIDLMRPMIDALAGSRTRAPAERAVRRHSSESKVRGESSRPGDADGGTAAQRAGAPSSPSGDDEAVRLRRTSRRALEDVRAEGALAGSPA